MSPVSGSKKNLFVKNTIYKKRVVDDFNLEANLELCFSQFLLESFN